MPIGEKSRGTTLRGIIGHWSGHWSNQTTYAIVGILNISVVGANFKN
jgi:hypothetical protein